MIEEWRDIVGYEGRYKVSNMGKVISLNYSHTGKQKELKQSFLSSGYCAVNLCKGGEVKLCSVHRLVATAFLSNPNKYKEVNHINENTKDNRVENLEWCDRLYNANYGTLKIRLRNIRAKNHCKAIYQYAIDRTFIAKYQSGREITRKLGFNNSYICRCCKKGIGIAYGYLWSYNKIGDVNRKGVCEMTRYESYNIDNDMWYKGRKHIYHLMGVYDGGRCACIIATYSLKTKRLLIKGANKHIPESSILKQFIEYAESKELQESEVEE